MHDKCIISASAVKQNLNISQFGMCVTCPTCQTILKTCSADVREHLDIPTSENEEKEIDGLIKKHN